jgi:hypothetical protein
MDRTLELLGLYCCYTPRQEHTHTHTHSTIHTVRTVEDGKQNQKPNHPLFLPPPPHSMEAIRHLQTSKQASKQAESCRTRTHAHAHAPTPTHPPTTKTQDTHKTHTPPPRPHHQPPARPASQARPGLARPKNKRCVVAERMSCTAEATPLWSGPAGTAGTAGTAVREWVGGGRRREWVFCGEYLYRATQRTVCAVRCGAVGGR